ncbi:AEC family transporter [Holosporaceae bacterium 'Namur']|nr:AEC family transporter [Holosporaceae bacterium 'Namur']
MQIFLSFCLKIWPLYIYIIMGYFGGRLFKIDRQSIASLLFYFIVPLVFFNVALNVKIQPCYLFLPLICFILCISLCFIYLYFAGKLWKDGKANLIAFAAGTGNTGYFGFPLALMLFDEHQVGIYMLGNIGFSLYDYTVGAYIITRGTYTKKQALHKVMRLPMIYAFILGLTLNYLGFKLPSEVSHFAQHLRGAYIVLGMMIIGLALANLEAYKIDYKFLACFLSAKFLAAPMIVLSVITLDQNVMHIFEGNEFIYKIMILLSIVPPAANTVVFATLNKCHPEQAAAAVLTGTVLGMVYVPAMVTWLI